ncbi:hypothetical protein DWX28_12590 [Blautia sp. AF19-10LB]|nr:hypothetical protein DWX28_12590 [Blautia sp. AF19-10LB]
MNSKKSKHRETRKHDQRLIRNKNLRKLFFIGRMSGEKELFFALYSKEAPDACPLILYKKLLKNSKIRKLKKIKEKKR